MNIKRLSWQNLVSNPLNTSLSLLLMTLGIGIISLILLLNNQIEQQLHNNLRGVDMVVGAKGSPLQLILSSIYHVDNPTGNIPYEEANAIADNRMVDFSIPLSYGDSYNGYRILGTTHQYLELYEANLEDGRFWNKSLEVVVGNTVAKVNQLKVGDTFYGTHGLSEGGHVHDEYSYEVVGVMNHSNSIIDNLIVSNLESVWQVHHHEAADSSSDKEHQNCQDHEHSHECTHDHHEEKIQIADDAMITAMLIKFKSPVGLIQFPRKVNETTNLQAAVPTFEIGRLTNLLGFGIQTLNSIALVIMIVSGLSIFISLFNSLKRRRYELAIMRVHGASKWQLVKLVLLEGLTLSTLGTLLGLLISRLTLLAMSLFVQHKIAFNAIQFNFLIEELWLFPSALFIGLIASLIPTIIIYRFNIPKILSNA